MNEDYFSDREQGPAARTDETISQVVWDAVIAIIQSLIADGSFGISFPGICPDGSDVVGTHVGQLQSVLLAEIPGIEWPFRSDLVPFTLAILDLVEFAHGHIAKPIQADYHEFFRHSHLSFDKRTGQAQFRERINRIFARNGLAYDLSAGGKIIRLAPTVLRETLQSTVFQTGDGTLDSLLESARLKFLNPDAKVRREALEKLWDAWERIKTIESGADKKSQAKTLLDKTAPEPHFRELLEVEARALTDIGNNFLIRHSETSRTPIEVGSHVDYLFHRLFALIWMVLKTRSTKS